LRKAVDFFSPGSIGWVEDGETTLNAKLSTTGLKKIKAEIAGSLPSLTLARGNRKAPVAAKDFKVIVTGDEKVFRVAIEGLPLVSPTLKIAGDIVFDRPSSSFSISSPGTNLTPA
jgi:hypothetical protein